MNDFDPDDGPMVAMPETPKRPHGCWIVFSIFMVFVLVGASASGAIWYFFLRERPSPVERDELVEATSVPSESTTAELSLPATSVPAPTAVPVPGEVVNRIVFVNDEGQLVSIAPDGSEEHVLTSAQQRFQFPAWSPDGRFVAAIGTDRTGAGVFVLDDSETEAAPLPLYADRRDAPFYLYWSPDSSQVSFLASHPDGMALNVVPADGSADSRLLTVGGPLYWQWAADSQQMLIHSGFAGADSRLELIAADSGKGDSLAIPGFFQAPGISADGRYLAYAEEITGANSRLVVMDTQSDKEVQQRHAGIVAMAWSPTANQLAFTNGSEPDSRSFVGPLRLVDAATGEIRVLSQEPIVAFFWSPDGRYLAAISILRSGEGDINVQNGKTAVGKQITQQSLPRLRLLVYDVAAEEGRFLFEFIPTYTFATQFLPFFDQYALSHHLWSPQSDALVLPMVEDGRNEIFIINITTGQKQFLADGLMPFWSPR